MSGTGPRRGKFVVRRYVVSLLACVLAVFPLLFTGRETEPSPFLLILAAVMFSSWYGGVGPALMTTAIGTLASVYVYLPPAQALDTAYVRPSIQEGLFVLVALFISYLAADLHRAQSRAREAAHRLRHQLDLSNALTRNLGEGLYALDREGRITFVNPAAEQMLGWTRSELLGQKLHALMHARSVAHQRETDHSRGLDPLRSQATTHVPLDVFTRKDGSLFPVDYIASPIRSGDAVTGMVVAFRDIGERVRSERRLSAQYAVARELVEHATLDDRVRGALAALCQAFDWPAGEFWILDARTASFRRHTVWHDSSFPLPMPDPQAKTTALPLSAGLPGRVAAAGKPCWTEGPPQEQDAPWLDPPSRQRIGGALALPVIGRRGAVGALTFFARDPIAPDADTLRSLATVGRQMGQCVETEHALRGSEARFRAIFEGMAVGALILDAEGRIVTSNAAVQSLLGFTGEELRRRTLMDLTGSADPYGDHDVFKQLVAGQTDASHGEQQYRRKDGQTVWVHVTMSLIREAADESEFAVAIVEDSSQRQSANQQLTENITFRS